ncbi:glycosyltransferase [Nocardioides sp. Iso805N]|uniref:glycosyltransferase n=1 Tax=Nocardioides sp. Iso805N TaxID=1283287 RepID=UPI0003743D12|nr:glycosyltransferase [Nocardioides sp. Iso805N]
MTAPGHTFTVLATFGTDHHRFDRLSRWLASWLAAHPDVRCLVQTGYSGTTAGAESIGIVSRAELLSRMEDADVVLGQGGPGTVLDAAVVGRIPVVVPRLARYGEVVDDHQVAFCRRMAADGRALLAESETQLHRLLDAALADPATVRTDAGSPPIHDTVDRVARLLRETASRPVGFVSLARLREIVQSRRSGTGAPVEQPRGAPASPGQSTETIIACEEVTPPPVTVNRRR